MLAFLAVLEVDKGCSGDSAKGSLTLEREVVTGKNSRDIRSPPTGGGNQINLLTIQLL